jgi:hypothetical protein
VAAASSVADGSRRASAGRSGASGWWFRWATSVASDSVTSPVANWRIHSLARSADACRIPPLTSVPTTRTVASSTLCTRSRAAFGRPGGATRTR